MDGTWKHLFLCITHVSDLECWYANYILVCLGLTKVGQLRSNKWTQIASRVGLRLSIYEKIIFDTNNKYKKYALVLKFYLVKKANRFAFQTYIHNLSRRKQDHTDKCSLELLSMFHHLNTGMRYTATVKLDNIDIYLYLIERTANMGWSGACVKLF